MAFIHLVVFIANILRVEEIENFAFYIKRHIWADKALKSGCGQFWDLFTLTKMHSV